MCTNSGGSPRKIIAIIGAQTLAAGALGLLCSLGVLVGLSGCAGPAATPPVTSAAIAMPPADRSPARLNRAIKEATGYLVRACDEDGRFIYQQHPNYPLPRSTYNILRHAGTTWALSWAHAHAPGAETAGALRRSAQYLLTTSVAPVEEGRGRTAMLALWSRPEIEGHNQPLQAKLGGAALAIIALSEAERITPGLVSREQLRQLGRFLVFMQRPDGSFYTRYIPDAGGRTAKPASIYYPGQAALALIHLHQHNPKGSWLKAAGRALGHIIEQRPHIVVEQWTALACAQLLQTKGYRDAILSRKTIRTYAEQLAKKIMEEQLIHTDNPGLVGSLEHRGRTAATATRVEALLALHTILARTDPMLAHGIRTCCDEAIGFLLNAQFTTGPCRGGFPRSGGIRGADAFFRAQERTVRIDTVQHALSALIGFTRSRH
ncbi:MAG: hypothetical protein ACOX5Z_10005 [Desulfobulbus sp.]